MTKRQRFQLPKENKVSAVDPEKVAAFVQGTLHEGSPNLPWGSLDPKAKPTSGINLRLNEYQLVTPLLWTVLRLSNQATSECLDS